MLITQGIETSLHQNKERKIIHILKSPTLRNEHYHEICYLDIELLIINYKQAKVLLQLKGQKDEFSSLAS